MGALTVASLHDQIIKLSPRQVEIVMLLVEGKTYTEISHILSISPETVKDHIREARRKLNVENRTQLIVVFVRWQTMQEMNNA